MQEPVRRSYLPNPLASRCDGNEGSSQLPLWVHGEEVGLLGAAREAKHPGRRLYPTLGRPDHDPYFLSSKTTPASGT